MVAHPAATLAVSSSQTVSGYECLFAYAFGQMLRIEQFDLAHHIERVRTDRDDLAEHGLRSM